MRSRSHTLTVKVSFDKPTTLTFAAAVVKHNLGGQKFDLSMYEQGPDDLKRPGSFTVRGVTRPAGRRGLR